MIDLPNSLIEVLLLLEDKRFPNHPGVDIFGIMRAMLANPRKNVLQGGSTLSQQLFSMRSQEALHKRHKRTLSFKLNQALWAFRHEAQTNKIDILTEYVNHVYLGRSHRGLSDAAWGYFGIAIQRISGAQAFFLAERIGSPNAIRPARLINLLNRNAIQNYFNRFQTSRESVLQVYLSVYGDLQDLCELNGKLSLTEEVTTTHGSISIQLDHL